MFWIETFFKDLFDLTNEMSPYLLLGFLLAGILKVFLPDNFIKKYLSSTNSKSVLNAALFGIPLPLCSCGVIPTGISLYKTGASKGASISFITSTPQTGVDSILVTYSLLGLPFAIMKVIVALITGVFSGAMTNIFDKSKTTIPNQKTPKPKTVQKSLLNKFVEMFRYAFIEFLSDIAKWIVIGLIIAAFISALLPNNFFTTYIRNDFLGMIVILIASIPIYVCATASVPIAAMLMLKGLSPGAALVFLLAGPATNAATITVINKILGKKAIFTYLFSIILCALIFGFIINNWLPKEWFSLHTYDNLVHHELIPYWLQYLSSIVLIILTFNAFRLKYKYRNQNYKLITDSKLLKVKVEGMTCNNCKSKVENAVKALANVKNVKVNLEKKIAYIEGENIDFEVVKKNIEKLGFQIKSNED